MTNSVDFRQRLSWTGLVILLLASLVYFTVRGPVRALQHSVAGPLRQDFPTFYAATKSWWLGGDPYDHSSLEAIFDHATPQQQWITGSLSSPSTFPVLVGISLFPYGTAELIWLALNTAFAVLAIHLLARLGQFSDDKYRLGIFASFALALATIHTSIAIGQITLAVTVCVLGTLVYELRGQDTRAGVLLGLALALKPQMAIVFLLYHFITRRWRVALSALAIFGAAGLLGVGRLAAARINWLDTYGHNLGAFLNGPGDTTRVQASMLNLQAPLSLILKNQVAVNAVTFIVVTAVLLVIAAFERNVSPTARTRLLVYACLSALAPLAVYSRFYTATLLIIPLAWAVSEYRSHFGRWPLLCVLLIGPFLLPGSAILTTMGASLPREITTSGVWLYVFLEHQTYAIAALLASLLVCVVRLRRLPVSPCSSHRQPGW